MGKSLIKIVFADFTHGSICLCMHRVVKSVKSECREKVTAEPIFPYLPFLSSILEIVTPFFQKPSGQSRHKPKRRDVRKWRARLSRSRDLCLRGKCLVPEMTFACRKLASASCRKILKERESIIRTLLQKGVIFILFIHKHKLSASIKMVTCIW